MNKELDYLDDILKNEPMTLNKRMIIECIKEKIQRIEAIDNAKPSEALKVLNSNPVIREEMDYEDYYTINKTLLKAQENEKVLEIIKKKDVDIIRIKHLIFESQKKPKYWDLRYYNEARVIDDEKLTQEEFDLLKRWLG